MNDQNSSNFIEELIKDDLETTKLNKKDLRFRFPPEPNGYLHIGHAKAIYINFFLSKTYQAPIHLRFDDTNPSKEEKRYVKAIEEDIQWLGFRWSHKFYTSNYFQQLYDWAIKLIRNNKAYIDEQSQEEIIKQKKNPFEVGINSPYRERSVLENLSLFQRMSKGEFEAGHCVLRAKINMRSPNMNLRDPVMYRILKVPHHQTNRTWHIYPTYDWAHGQSDYIEQISHSLCSLEFHHHKPLYNWYLDQIYEPGKLRPKQHEFSRLNLSHTLMSKRILQYLIQEKFVTGWDDPRMPTLRGFRRRGYTPESICNFCQRIGISKRENIIQISLLEFIIRQELNKTSPRVMAIVNPVKLIIENYPEDKIEWIEVENNPENFTAGTRKIPFSKILYIEREDFMEESSNLFFRLSINKKVRLKNAYIITGCGCRKDNNGVITEIYAQYDPKSRSGSLIQDHFSKVVKSTLHWVSVYHSVNIEVRLYEQLFLVSSPESYKKEDFVKIINPNSLKIVQGYGEPSLKKVQNGERFQFQRLGYFCVDQDTSIKKIIFNRTVTLKDNWTKKN